MSQDLTESYKKLDALKQLECDTNIVYILEILNKWNKNADNKQLKKVITSFLEVQFYLIELKRDRDLSLRALTKYKMQRNAAIEELQEYKQKLIKYENKHFTGNRRRDTQQRRS